MIERMMAKVLKQHLKWFSVAHISGPRQSGKTTLTKMTLPKAPYANLENPSTLSLCVEDPRGFLESLLRKGRPAVIDEAQRFPELFSWIQVICDEISENGLFVLTGSQNFLMNERISQSLAGRVSVLTLLPLSLSERGIKGMTIDEVMRLGCFPRLFDENREIPPPEILYDNYVTTYLERDVRQLTAVHDLDLFHRFLRLCAARIGQLLNKANLSMESDVSQTTIERWLSILETSNVIFRLRPFHGNVKKRLVKTPKLYFCDTGLACHLMGVKTADTLNVHSSRGALFENLVYVELLKKSFNQGRKPDIHFFRDKTGREIDFLLGAEGGELEALEVKSGRTARREFIDDLLVARKLIRGRIDATTLLHAGPEETMVKGVSVRNAFNYLND